MRKLHVALVMAVLLSGCDLAPDWSVPVMALPDAFKEDVGTEMATVEPAADGKWKRFDEKAKIEDFAWWRMFHDATLDALMEQAMKENPTLDVAINRVVAARSVVDTRAAELYPRIGVGFGPERTRQSVAGQEPNLPPNTPANAKPYTLYSANGSISYDLDLFGQNRARTRAAQLDANAEQNNYRAARLALQAEIAQGYFRVTALRNEDAIIRDTLRAHEKTLELTRAKAAQGVTDALAVAAIEADVAATRVQAASLAQLVAVAEHAMAALLGQPPAQLTLTTAELKQAPPVVPAGLPSSLLERRPDIQQAVNLMAAANERIGVARGGYFPDISLSAMGGVVAGDVGDLFKWSNRTWTIGPLVGTVLTQPIFEGGKIAAARAQTQADFDGAVAQYRASVLGAFREVEDQLSGVRYLQVQAQAADDSVRAATRAHSAANERFKVGYSSYLDYLEAKRNLLTAKRSKVQVRANQFIATIQLVKALGGSWEAPPAPEVTGTMARVH